MIGARLIQKYRSAAYAIMYLVALVVAAAAYAQEPPSLEELAKLRANPLSGLHNFTLQDQGNFDFAGTGQAQNVITLQAVYAVSLSENWSLVAQPIVPIVTQPGSDPGEGQTSGLGATVVTAVITPKETGTLIWGVGPVLGIPTTTDHELGTERWAAGPSIALFVEPGNWILGVLLQNAWSFAGGGDSSVNAFGGEYFLTYNLPQGWFLESNATATADWEAPENARWTVPLGGGGGKVFTLGKQSLSASAQAFYNIVTPSSGSDWSLSVALQILLPE